MILVLFLYSRRTFEIATTYYSVGIWVCLSWIFVFMLSSWAKKSPFYLHTHKHTVRLFTSILSTCWWWIKKVLINISLRIIILRQDIVFSYNTSSYDSNLSHQLVNDGLKIKMNDNKTEYHHEWMMDFSYWQ